MGACVKKPYFIVTELMKYNLFDILHNKKIELTTKLKLTFAKEVNIS